MSLNLLMLPTAPVLSEPDGSVVLDTKFIDGMNMICAAWPGKVDCILRTGADAIPFGTTFKEPNFDFGIEIIDADAEVSPRVLNRYDVVLAAADSHKDLGLADHASSAALVYAIEYTIRTRLQIVRMDKGRGVVRQIWSALWNLRQEMRRRSAFRKADGIQANGYPAFSAYRDLNSDTMLYLDNRMKPEMFATQEEMNARAVFLKGRKPLRLINSGRLEPMKGSHDLLPFARHLRQNGVEFTLDIYGAGSMREQISWDVQESNLDSCVRLHDPVDFETELVPLSRTQADVFLSCHRQSDPSCSYLEAMGCGLPIAGYDNEMLQDMLKASSAGWSVPLGKYDLLADLVSKIDRIDLVQKSRNALEFAKEHDFESEFKVRLEHLVNTKLKKNS